MPKRKVLPPPVAAALRVPPSPPRNAIAVKPVRKQPCYGAGVAKTGSGKFQARIKLNGKRYDLGSNFNTPEEAAAAYSKAKREGRTDRPSPKHDRNIRGTGTPAHTTQQTHSA